MDSCVIPVKCVAVPQPTFLNHNPGHDEARPKCLVRHGPKLFALAGVVKGHATRPNFNERNRTRTPLVGGLPHLTFGRNWKGVGHALRLFARAVVAAGALEHQAFLQHVLHLI